MSTAIYKAHAIHASVQQILALQTDEEFLKLSTPLTEDQQWQLERVFEVVRVIERLLEQTPSTLVSIAQLNAVQSTMAQIQAEFSAFRSNKNPTHVTNASTFVDNQAIPQIGYSFGIKPKDIASGKLGDIVDELRKRSSDAITALGEEKDDLAKGLVGLGNLLNEQDKRVSELTVAVEAQKKEAVAVTAVVEGRYAKTETEILEKFNAKIAEIESSYKAFHERTEKVADAHLLALNGQEEKARELVGLVGDTAVTGNYKVIANAETIQANIWRKASVWFFAVGVTIAVAAFLEHVFKGSTTADFWTFATRFITAIAVASPAFYTARESARHRTNADRARQRELELAALGPFIQDLSQAEQVSIRNELVKRYFGNDIAPHEVQQPIDGKSIAEVAKTAIEAVVKVAK
jgi:DNA-binding Lrp family transcriptional regulator